MRIRELGLVAFGPFADVRLDFSTAPAALHVIYGTNEAGKSTTLRAISGLLFGIPHQTPDAHRHEPKKLRVFGALEDGRGNVLELLRRKGRKGTLRAADGAAVDDAVIRRLLGGVSEAAFSTMFGLDHRTLAQGARAMLEGKGDVGESLFGAGIGGRGVHALFTQLNEESEQLFTPRGRGKKLINQAIVELRESRRSVDDLSMSAKGYLETKRAVEAAEARRAELKERSQALAAEQRRLQRLIGVLPALAERAELLQRLSELGALPDLPEDSRERRLAAQEAIREAQRELERERPRLRGVEEELGRLVAPRGLLGLDPAVVDDVRQRLHRYLAARADLPRKSGALEEIQSAIARGLAELRRDVPVENAEQLRLGPAAAARVQALAARRGEIVADAGHARRQLEAHREKERQARERLDAVGPPAALSVLKRTLDDVARAGDLSRRIEEASVRVESLGQSVQAHRAALGSWGLCEDLAPASPPDGQSVDRFAAAHAELAARARRIDDERREVADRIRDVDCDLAELNAEGDVPTEEQLGQARSSRDEAWRRLRGHAEHGAIDPAEADEYEETVEAADVLADRLRREAARTERLARLRAERAALADKVESLEATLGRLGEEEAELLRHWKHLWTPLGIEPGSADEMRGFLRRFAMLERVREDERAAREELSALERERAHQARVLTDALRSVGIERRADATRDELARETQAAYDRLVAREVERQQAEEQLAATHLEVRQLERECAEREGALDTWQRDWQRALEPLGLPAEASPTEAQAVLERMAELVRRVDEASSLGRSIEAAEDECRRFEADVLALCREHAADLLEMPAAEAADGFLRAHAEAQGDERERLRRADEVARLRESIEEHEAACRRGEQELAALMRGAAVDSVAALEAMEQKVRARLELEASLRAVEQRLLKSAEGQSIEALVEQTRALDADRARARLAEIEPELEEVQDALLQTVHEEGAARAGLGRYEESDAAEAALEAQQRVARLRANVERYVRVRLAARILEQEIERYRQENQGPLLSRSTELFSALTVGRYTRLDVGYDDKDRPVLRCIRADGKEVAVEELSEGTASQLYLALRLASLERYAAASEPMPVVLDDILIHFDDERAEAALRLLADLSRSTQVLFFTHHHRLVEIARRALPGERVVEHELPRAG